MSHSVYSWLRTFFHSEQFTKDLSFFRSVPIFHGLSGRQLGRVILAMQKRTYQAGEPLFAEGQEGKAVFIIRSGQVELTRKLPDGSSRSLGLLGPGQIFGEMALLEKMERTAAATMVQDGEIYLLYAATLDAFVSRHPVIGMRIMRNIAVMLSALVRKTNKEMDQRLQST